MDGRGLGGCLQNNDKTISYDAMRVALPLLVGMTLLVGCASKPGREEQHAATPRVVANLGDVRTRGAPARKTRFMLIALPDRVYEVPVTVPATTAVVPAHVVRASESAVASLAQDGAVAYALVEPEKLPILVQALPEVMPGAPLSRMLALADHVVQPAVHPSAAIQPVAPRLKMDTDYVFATQPARLAFHRNGAGA